MNSFALEIWDDECEKVTFYSVRWADTGDLEVDRFFDRMGRIPEQEHCLQELLQLIIEVIGNTYGAQEAFFNRFENRVTALPPRGDIKVSELELSYPGFPLRLYCLVLSEHIVVLFNGGIKDAQSVQGTSGTISTKFHEANEFARRILSAMQEGEIVVDGRVIVDYRGGTEIYL